MPMPAGCTCSSKLKQTVATFIFVVGLITAVSLAFFDFDKDSSRKYKVIDNEELLVDYKHCKIPKVVLENEALKKLWNKPKAVNCSLNRKLSHLTEDERLIIYGKDDKSCCLREIERPVNMPGDKYKLSPNCSSILNNTDVSTKKLFLVECSSGNSEMHYNFHATSFENETVPPKISFWNSIKKSERPVSVLMIVLESASRHDAFRSLGNTVDYLVTEHNFVDFKGHHILGEPDFPNIFPLLLGTAADDFWGKLKTDWNAPWDSYPFIWSNFSKLNYITYFSEDGEGIFNTKGQQGFTEQPTDYYIRPLIDSHRDAVFSSLSDLREYCFGTETVTEFVLNYHKKLLLKFQDIPTFSLNRISWPQNENLESLFDLDGPLLKYFESVLGSRVIYENTVIIFTSDHGSTNHSYSNTFEGLLERRLPFLFFHLPKRLAVNNPRFTTNLMFNSRTLTSHFDTFETLLHLVKLAKGAVTGKNPANATKEDNSTESPDSTFRKSFLNFIPPERTCQDAHIPAYICSCNLPEPVVNVTDFNALHQNIPENVRLPTFHEVPLLAIPQSE